MPPKDYYKILELPRNAGAADIKRAFRMLAMRYHPDKTNGNKADADRFLEVHEAYRVLSDTRSRTSYNQQWWYKTADRATQRFEADTPQAMVFKANRLRRYLATVQNNAIDQDALLAYLNGLLSDHAVTMVSAAADANSNRKIIDDILYAVRLLDHSATQLIEAKLHQLAGQDATSLTNIASARRNQQWDGYWHKYQGLLIFLAAILLCLLIYAAGT